MQLQALNKCDFPAINSSVHNQSIILTRLDPTTSERFFLCAQDIIEGVAGDKSELQTYEEFCNQLKQPRTKFQMDQDKEKEIKQLIGQKNANLQKFSKQIEEEKLVVKRLINDKLEQLYKKKCNDLVGQLHSQLDQQYQLFSENYEKLVQEDKADHDKNAAVDKYEEIKKKVKEMNDPQHIEDYLQSTYKTKIAWNKASEQLQQAEQRDKQFYKSNIEKQLANTPELADAERIVDVWVDGLDKLVEEVKNDQGIIKNMIQEDSLKLPLIASLNEFELVQNTMIKNDTQLIVKLNNEINFQQIIKFKFQLAGLKNLKHFVFDAEEGKLSENFINEFIQPFNQLDKLESFHIKCFGSKITNTGLAKLSEVFQVLPNLKELYLEIGYNQITTEGLNKLAENFNFLKNLQKLNLSFECNKITNKHFNIFCEKLELIIPQLIALRINFGGNQFCQNAIESTGAISLVKCFAKAEKMKVLELNFGQNKINNQFISELAAILSQLNLTDLTLLLNNNNLDCKSAKKISKYFKNCKLCKLSLNLSGNKIQTEGASIIVEAINQMELLFQLKINLRNCEIKKGNATILKGKLEMKKGRQFDEVEFLA